MQLDEWFLTAAQRGNPATRLDSRHPDGLAWSVGNEVRPLIHGMSYFDRLLTRVNAMQTGDLLMFTDWRGDPDEWLDGGPDTAVADVFCAAAKRGVLVRGLLWRSHLDRFQFSEQENRSLGDEIEAAGGCCLLDMRVRPGGSHHMKLVVLRHPSRPERDVAFVGGIDLCHSRRDDRRHLGDPQRQPMSSVYGSRPPWHDIQAMIQGPAVGDVETVFRERWEDPAPLTRNPLHRLRDAATGRDHHAQPLPAQLPDPRPRGTHAVQLLRTYPGRRPGYDFAPDGERSIARAYLKVLPRARSLIYLEDQYLWSEEVVKVLADALRDTPRLHLIAVIPRFPDQDGRISTPPNLIGRVDALDLLYAAGGSRVAVYGLENAGGIPIYVHAKVCIVDDTWAIIGSDNFNRRSWTHDSEVSCAILDEAAWPAAGSGAQPDDEPGTQPDAQPAGGPGAVGTFARRLRIALGAEHLGAEHPGTEHRGTEHPGTAVDAAAAPTPGGLEMFESFERAAAALDAWHEGGRRGPRPPGQLRRYPTPQIPAATRMWASALYRLIYDPDGRPPSMRRAGLF